MEKHKIATERTNQRKDIFNGMNTFMKQRKPTEQTYRTNLYNYIRL